MDEAVLKEMKVLLEKERERINEELARFDDRKKTAKEKTKLANDESAQQLGELGNERPLEDTLRKLLRDTLAALARMEAGDYGVCKYCQTAIEEGRLRARPASSSCISCKRTLTQEV